MKKSPIYIYFQIAIDKKAVSMFFTYQRRQHRQSLDFDRW